MILCLFAVGGLLFGTLLLAIGLCLRKVAELLIEIGEDCTPRARAIWFGIELVVASIVVCYLSSLNKIPINILTYFIGLIFWFIGKFIARFIKSSFTNLRVYLRKRETHNSHALKQRERYETDLTDQETQDPISP
jgi:hypothetical protein